MMFRNQSMRAVVYESYGSPDVLRVADVGRPAVGPGEVMVDVHASVVTQGDRRMRAADYPGFLRLFGRLATGVLRPRYTIPGTNFSGVVVRAGGGVEQFGEGDRVFGSCMHGAHADFLVIDETAAIAEMPRNLTFEEAADLPYGAGTAFDFLTNKGGLEPGDQVAVVGAAGGVGRYAVQIAKHFGGEVTAVCREKDADFVRELGAARVVDYTAEDVFAADNAYDVIFDTSGTLRFSECKRSLTVQGRFLSLYMSAGLLWQTLWTSVTGGRRAVTGVAIDSAETLRRVKELAEAGGIRSTIARRFSMDQIADAHRYLEAREGRGSVVVGV
jgi:NADPH:quinone reductase-like Zn-dependent oxidoreductase